MKLFPNSALSLCLCAFFPPFQFHLNWIFHRTVFEQVICHLIFQHFPRINNNIWESTKKQFRVHFLWDSSRRPLIFTAVCFFMGAFFPHYLLTCVCKSVYSFEWVWVYEYICVRVWSIMKTCRQKQFSHLIVMKIFSMIWWNQRVSRP